jgi:hypothetical protein
VALLHQFETLAFFPFAPRVQCQLAEQTLIQARLQWDLLFEPQLVALDRRYRVLVLPEVLCLSDAQVALLRQRVAEGLGLVVTGATGSLTPGTRARRQWPLGELWGESDPTYLEWGAARRADFGKGRVVWLPHLVPQRSVEPRDQPESGYLYVETFQLPVNWRELAEAVAWAGHGLSVQVEAPPSVVAEITRAAVGGTLLVQLVNYQPANPVRGIRVRLAPGAVARNARVRTLTYDAGERQVMVDTTSTGELQILLDWLDRYALILVESTL